MKITVEKPTAQEQPQPPPNPSPLPDLSDKPKFSRKPPRRKTAGIRLRRDAAGAQSGKRSSRPETPLLRWKFNDGNGKNDKDLAEEEKLGGEVSRKSGRKIRDVVSARKLGAGLWRMAEFQTNAGQGLGLQSRVGHFVGTPIHGHHLDRVHSSPARDSIHSPHSVSGPKHGIHYQFEPSHQFSNYAMEGVTKWDPVGWKTSDDWKQIFGQPKPPENHQANTSKAISALETELEQAKTRINELETDRRSSKKKLEHFLKKLSEERSAWRSREHEKIRLIIDDVKSELKSEKKARQRLEIVNSKLVNELADARSSAKRYLHEYEKERKARELIEDVCDELAKEIGEDKAEVEELKRDSMKLREEVDDERKMLQMAEVWREERVQMKLVDAKVMLEEKYSQMKTLIANLDSFLSSSSTNNSDSEEIKKAEFLRQVAASVNMQDVREITYEPPSTDDIFSVFEDVNFGGDSNDSPELEEEVKMLDEDNNNNNNGAHIRNSSGDQLEEDASEWETVSHQGSSYSPDVSRNGTEFEKNETFPKGSYGSKVWRSEGKNGRLSCNGPIMSPDGLSPQDLGGQWSSPDIGNPHINRAMKGCIEWPRGAQKGSLKSRLLEARMESQKVQLRQVLKQKI